MSTLAATAAAEAAQASKTVSIEKYEQIGAQLTSKKEHLISLEQELVKQKKSPEFDPKNKTAEFQQLEKEVKQMKEEVNQLAKEWRRADPNKLHMDREEFDAHLVRRFLVIPSFEIYGGVSGLYDFGPVACAVKANVINLWRQHFILEESMLELECTTLTPEPVFAVSGHVERFADYIVRDTVTGDGYRADKLLAEVCEARLEDPNTKPEEAEKINTVLQELESYDKQALEAKFRELNVKAPGTGNELSEPLPFNLMFGTQIGPTGKSQGYLRPETAQGLFVNFKRCLDYNGAQVPFAIATVGQAYRNEIAPRSGLLRVREFTLAEIEHFVNPSHTEHPKFVDVQDVHVRLLSRELQSQGKQPAAMTIGEAHSRGIIANQTLAYFIARTSLFMSKVGILEQGIRFRQHMANEMAHYASDCWDCELLTSYGWVECVGLADRSCYDLSAHSKGNTTNTSLVAWEQFPEPQIVDEVVVVPNKSKYGATLQAKAKPVAEYLDSLSNDDKLAVQQQLNDQGEATITVLDGSQVKLTKDLLEIKKQQKKIAGRNYVPSVIEPSFGIGRIIYAILEHSFWIRQEEEEEEQQKAEPAGKKGGKKAAQKERLSRVVFSFSPVIASYKVAIMPLQQNPEFDPFINTLRRQLNSAAISNRVDLGGQAIGKKYARMDDIGIPFAITVDFQSLKDNTVTLRERDSCTQIRISLEEVCPVINELMDNKTTWQEVRERYPEQHQTASEKVGKKL